MSTAQLTREEAQRQIDELRRHIASLEPQAIPIPNDIKVGDTVILNNGERRKVTYIHGIDYNDPRIHVSCKDQADDKGLAVVNMRTGRSWGGHCDDEWVVTIERKQPKYRMWLPSEIPIGYMAKQVGVDVVGMITGVVGDNHDCAYIAQLPNIYRGNFQQYHVAPPGPIGTANWQPAGVLIED